MEKQRIKNKLTTLHEQENEYNLEMSKIDKQVKQLNKRKLKLSRMVSSNMRYRNQLINEVNNDKHG